MSLPFLVRGDGDPTSALLTLLAIGVVLTAVFTAIAFCIVLRAEWLRGLGIALGVWMATASRSPGRLVVVAIFTYYPIERPLLALRFHPIDLVHADAAAPGLAALMGYTGAVFQRFFAETSASLWRVPRSLGGSSSHWRLAPERFAARIFVGSRGPYPEERSDERVPASVGAAFGYAVDESRSFASLGRQ